MIKIIRIIAGNKQLKKKANCKIKMKNGNNNLKIFTWNKTDSNIAIKIKDIKEIIVKHKPSILFIQELNLKIDQYQNIINIPGYKFEIDNLLESNRLGRIRCWINKKLVYERIKHIEDKRNPIIALNI